MLKRHYRNFEMKILPHCNFHKQKFNKELFAVEICGKVGFFATINWCLYVLSYCDEARKIPYIYLTSQLYTSENKGNDWFKYFFKNNLLDDYFFNKFSNRKIFISKIKDLNELGLPSKINYQNMTLDHANYLFFKYFSIKEEILEYVENYIERNFENKKTLGVHYRGTDKKGEASQITYEYCFKAIEKFLEINPEYGTLFVSTDENGFLLYLKNKKISAELFYHEDMVRSVDNKPLHYNYENIDNYLKGKEALVNCLILSKCDFLIRTSSFLSGWASVFNNKLPVTMLNSPYKEHLWFPDRETLKISDSQYLP